jgi:hypothetical protein
VPDPSDVVQIALGGSYAVTLDVSPTVAGLEIGTGGSGVQTLSATSRILTVAGDVIVGPQGALDFNSASIAGVGTLNNDGLVTLRNASLALSLDNRATFVASGSSALNGGLSTAPGSMLRVAQVDGCCSTATLAVASGFTNEGTIELSNHVRRVSVRRAAQRRGHARSTHPAGRSHRSAARPRAARAASPPTSTTAARCSSPCRSCSPAAARRTRTAARST